MRYFARQRRVDDFPHNGELCWGVADSLGGFVICRDEESAVSEAMLRNAMSQTAE